jgi:polyvinyl alcohol dehydrogenase (cytochrome)
MTRLTRGVWTALPAFALIIALVPPHAVASGSSDWPCQWGMYGGNPARTFEAACDSPINPLTVPTLLPAWPPFKTTGTVTASPVVVDGKLFVGDWSGAMYAIDTEQGTPAWKPYQTTPAPGAAFGPIVSSAAVADVAIGTETRRLVIFGAGPRVYALDANTGSPSTEPTEVWVSDFGQLVEDPGEPDPTEVESSPVVWNDRVYVGMDTHDRPASAVGDCKGATGAIPCTGGLLVLDAATGKLLWKFDPELGVVIGANGVPLTTPPADRPHSGCGGIWGSPTLDATAGIVYFGTANCQSNNPDAWNTPHAEAITALDANTGTVIWTFQPHVPENHADWDFGATPNLFTDASGRKVLGAGNKDGSYYALDAATGAPIWSPPHVAYGDPFGDDFAIGGFIGSPAVSHFDDGAGEKVYVVGGTAIGPPIGEEGIKGYYHAINAADGKNPWADPVTGEIPTGGIGGPSYAASATVNGVVFSGALDNLFKAYEAGSGALIWAMPLLGPISSGPAIVGDTVYVGSGTSSSDLCAKELPGSELCILYFDTILGGTGGIHAFRLLPIPG